MSRDEFIVLLLGAAFGGWGAWNWYARIFNPQLARPLTASTWLALAPLVALVGLFATLRLAASFDVREAPQYLLLYTLLGGAWMCGAVGVLALMGVSFRDDVIERRNPAAAIVVVSALLASTAIYAGANIGDGPGWWCVIAAALIGMMAWSVLYLAIEIACSANELVTVERDPAFAIRLSGYMIGTGLICARGSAGDWTSLGDTIIEFWVAWPAVAVTGLAIAIERTLLRGDTAKNLVTAITVALAILVLSGFAVAYSPPLPQNPLYGDEQ